MSDSHYERLSGQDLSFLALEDGRVHMHVGMVTIFDAGPLRLDSGGIDFERIYAYIGAQLHKVPRLRQKLAWVRGIGQPVWIDDPNFNLHFHVRHTALPPPGDIRQLKRLAGRVMSQELDRGKPLWEYWFVDCIEDDRFALIAKVHHCIADGIAGLEMTGKLILPDADYEPEQAPQWAPRRAPGDARLLADELRHRARMPVEILVEQVRRLGSWLPGSASLVTELRDLAGAAFGGVTTPLNAPIGPHRRFDWTLLPLEEVHDVATRAGGKINDVVLAVTAGALRRFLEERGMAVEGIELRAMVPVNVRDDSNATAMGNRVSGVIVPLPVGEADPVERLRRVIDRTRQIKASHQSEIAAAMSAMIDLVPPSLMGPTFRWGSQLTPAHLAVSNVPGPRQPVYLLGARQREVYPAVPLIANHALGITQMSYDANLCWGFNSDWDVVPDLHDLVELVETGFDELRQVVET